MMEFLSSLLFCTCAQVVSLCAVSPPPFSAICAISAISILQFSAPNFFHGSPICLTLPRRIMRRMAGSVIPDMVST